MKICETHWAKLRQAIRDRGLYHLVAKSGEAAADNIKAEAQGLPHDYDPLMDCNMMIMSAGLKDGGLRLLTPKEDGSHYCPVCEAEAHGVPVGDWINGPADCALQLAREKGLVPAVQ
jgi:hypothetical protein